MKLNIYEIARQATALIYEREPGLLGQFGEQGKEKCLEDNEHHMKQLLTAYDLDNAQIFIDYAVWLHGILKKHDMTAQHLLDNFHILKELLPVEMPETKSLEVYLDSAMQALQTAQ